MLGERIMTCRSGLTARFPTFLSTYLASYQKYLMNSGPRCQKRRKGYASRCDRPAKVGFMSVYDMDVIFWCCGFHKRILMKYALRGSFFRVSTGIEGKTT